MKINLSNNVNKGKYIINILFTISNILFLGSCSSSKTTIKMMDAGKQNNKEERHIQRLPNKEKIKITDITAIPVDKQKIYLNQIAQWYYAAWGQYCISEKPNYQYFQIPKEELVPGQLPITLVAYDTITDTLIAVVRLKNDTVVDAYKEKIFPEGSYRPSGLYVDKNYRNKGIGQMIVKHILTLAVEQYQATCLGFYSHSKEAQKTYEHYGIPLLGTRKIHDKEAAIYLVENPSLLLQKLQAYPKLT